MGPTNKVLTVAYGTFSCTLEGFDDPFSTMRDISEYFRELAERDRYFGAEPPQPDMAMLRHIAETTSRARIDAEASGDGAVTLRQAPAAAVEAAEPVEAAAEVEVPASEPVIKETVAGAADDAEPTEAPEAEAEEAPATMHDAVDDVAAAVAAEVAEPEVAEPEVEEPTKVEADAPADAAEEASGAPAPVEVEAEAEPAPLRAERPRDSATDRLALLRTAAAAVEDEYQEDEHAEAFPTEAAFAPAPVVEPEPEAEAAPAPTAEEEAPEAPAAEDEAAAPRRSIRVRRIRAVAPPEAADPAEETEAKVEAVTPEAEAPAPEADPVEAAMPDADTDAATADLPQDEEADLMAELAAIEAELTGDVPAAPSAAEAPAPTPEPELALAPEVEPEPELEPVSEAAPAAVSEDDTIAALADIMRDAGADPAPEPEAPIATAASDADEIRAARSLRRQRIAETDADVDTDRLFDQTDDELSGEETSRRHANISHLKAAVAARRADPDLALPGGEDSEPYRADLAESVQARRPRRPAEPLVLASEQRVDAPAPATDAEASDDAAPQRVVPRRATVTVRRPEPTEAAAPAPAPATAPAPVPPRSEEVRKVRRALAVETPDLTDAEEAMARIEGAPDFESFAEDVGARDLAEVLEAAAAYAATVMGQDTFSRPRLLHLASEAHDEFSREDGLRSFGQLLRDGRIRKVGRGVYAPADGGRYAGEAERLAG